MPTRKEIDNSNQPIKDIKWQKEYCYSSDDFMVMPFCPSCGEPAYEENECMFCHQKYRFIPKPKDYEDVIITIGEWEICQVYGSWGVYISHNGRIVVHASCGSPISKRKLKEWLESYANK